LCNKHFTVRINCRRINEGDIVIGERLAELRKKHNMTQEELAEKLEVSRQAVSKWELDKTMPDVSKLTKMSELYQVSVDYLLKGEEAAEVTAGAGKNNVSGEPGADAAAGENKTDTVTDENETGTGIDESGEYTKSDESGTNMVDDLTDNSRHEKKNKDKSASGRKHVTIAAILIAVILAGVLALVLVLNKKANSLKETETSYMGTVVLDGFEINIPDKYAAAVYEDVGLSYFDSDTFEMGISVVDGSYDETLSDLENMSGQISDWFTLLEPFSEITVNGHAYIYCVYADEGETILLAYNAADDEHSFEIMVRCLSVDRLRFQTENELKAEYESFMTTVDTLLGNAKLTDEENTPAGTTFVSAHMYSDLKVEYPESFEAEDTLGDDAGNEWVKFRVEDGYYRYAEEYRKACYSMKVYENLDENVVVTLIADDWQEKETDAQKLMLDGAAKWTGGRSEVKSLDVDGRTIYYYTYTVPYVSMDKELEKYYLEAAVDLDDGRIYRVSGYSEDNKKALEIENYMKFLEIN
jgi:transcriptional regulator with XRE-family HTH domain